jgi:triacylglycerol lipase
MKAFAISLPFASLLLCPMAVCLGQEGNGESARRIHVIPNVEYAERGDEKLLADLYVPKGAGPFPGVLMVHGGAWMSGNKWHMAHHARAVAAAGYTVVAINYRLAPKHIFPAQIEDCREALQWMRANAQPHKIDAQRLVGYGYSAGAHLVCLLGFAEPAGNESRLKAIVAGGAPCDFRTLPPRNTALAYFLGGSRSEKPEAYRDASPAAFVSVDDPPVYFFHGQQDALVPLQGPTRVMESLKAAGVRAELLTLPEKGHIATFFDAGVPAKAIAFLDEIVTADEAE